MKKLFVLFLFLSVSFSYGEDILGQSITWVSTNGNMSITNKAIQPMGISSLSILYPSPSHTTLVYFVEAGTNYLVYSNTTAVDSRTVLVTSSSLEGLYARENGIFKLNCNTDGLVRVHWDLKYGQQFP